MSSVGYRFFLRLQQITFLLIVFFLPTQLGLHFWPDYAYIMGRRIDYLSPTLFFTDTLIIILIIENIALSFFSGSTTFYRNKLIVSKRPITSYFTYWSRRWRVVVFFLSIIAGIWFSSRPPLGLITLLKILELSVFALIASRLFRKKNIQKMLVLVFASSMLIQSLLGVGQFLLQGSLGSLLYFLGERSFVSQTPGIAVASLGGALLLRPYGTLPHPNVLAGYLLIGVLIVVFSVKRYKSTLKKSYLYVSLCLSLIAIMLTMSRSVIVVGAILATYFLILKLNHLMDVGKSKKAVQVESVLFLFLKAHIGKIWWMIVLGVMGIVMPFLLVPNLVLRFFEFSFIDESFVQRVDLFKSAAYMFWSHPVLGVGIGNFLVVLPSYISLYKTPLQPVHNIYLLILTETGIVGFTLIALMTKNLYIKLKSLIKTHPEMILMFWAVMLLGVFDHYFLTLQQGRLLLALIIGMIIALDQSFRTPSREI